MKTITEKQTESADSFLSSDNNSKILAQLTEVLSVLSKNDALTIFFMANEGIKSELDTPIKIGLTKKQYYTRLKQLVDLGLIAKNNESYIQTAFGKVVYQKHIIGLTNNIKNSKYLQMVDVLKADPKFNDKDIMEFMSKVEPQISSDLQNAPKKISVIASYEDMVRKALEIIEFAQNEICLVTRFQNDLIINAILKKASMGVSVRALADIDLVEQYFGNEKEIKKDKNQNERVNVVSNPFYPSKIERRYVKVPFSIIVVDNKHIGFEITDISEPKKFKTSLYIEDENISPHFVAIFDDLWKKSSATPPKIVTKSVSRN